MKIPRIVYALRLEATGKIYIGSTADLQKRFESHCSRLKCGTHNSKSLQADYDRSEHKDLTITALEEITTYTEKDKEYKWMGVYQSFDPVHGYNCDDPHFDHRPRVKGWRTNRQPVPNNITKYTK